jgi:hypothetical protein
VILENAATEVDPGENGLRAVSRAQAQSSRACFINLQVADGFACLGKRKR